MAVTLHTNAEVDAGERVTVEVREFENSGDSTASGTQKVEVENGENSYDLDDLDADPAHYYELRIDLYAGVEGASEFVFEEGEAIIVEGDDGGGSGFVTQEGNPVVAAGESGAVFVEGEGLGGGDEGGTTPWFHSGELVFS